MESTESTHPTTSRRSVVKALAGGAMILAAAASSADAAIGASNIPTQMSVSVTPTSIRRGQKATVTARVTRVDNGQPVQGASIRFIWGNPTYPNSVICNSVYTNRNGVASVSFTVSRYHSTTGRNIVLAEMTDKNPYYHALPFANIAVAK